MRCNVQRDLDARMDELSRLENEQHEICERAKTHFLDCKLVQAILRTEHGNKFQAYFNGLSMEQREDSVNWKWHEIVMEWLEENT